MNWLGLLLGELDRENPIAAAKALECVLTRSYPPHHTAFDDAPDFRLQGGFPRNPDPVAELSTVLRLSRLRNLVHEDDKFRLPPLLEFGNSSLGSEMFSEWQEKWQDQPHEERRVRIDPIESLGRLGAVLWFTPRTCLESFLERESLHKAQRAHDVLGLVHHQVDTVLVALHFEGEMFSDFESDRPTFLDAAGHFRFKAWPDEKNLQEKRHWGVTVDLRKDMSSKSSLDGSLERVMRSIPRTMKDVFPLECEIEILGFVRENNGTGSAADKAFANRLTDGLGERPLADKLKRLLN